MITEPPKPPESVDDSEDFWPSAEQKQDLLNLCEQITGESPTPSHLPRRHLHRLRGFVTVAVVLFITMGLLSTGWGSSFHFYGVAEHAKELQLQAEKQEQLRLEYKNRLKSKLATISETAASMIVEKKYSDAFVYFDALIETNPTPEAAIARNIGLHKFLHAYFGEDMDLTQLMVIIDELDEARPK